MLGAFRKRLPELFEKRATTYTASVRSSDYCAFPRVIFPLRKIIRVSNYYKSRTYKNIFGCGKRLLCTVSIHAYCFIDHARHTKLSADPRKRRGVFLLPRGVCE